MSLMKKCETDRGKNYALGHGQQFSTSAVVLVWWSLLICLNLIPLWKTTGGETKLPLVGNLSNSSKRQE